MIQGIHKIFILIRFPIWGMLFLLLVNPCFSQPEELQTLLNDMHKPVLYGEILGAQAEVAGSRFLNDVWVSGTVYLESGSVVRDIMIRYDGYADQLQWYNQVKNKVVIVEKAAVRSFAMPGYTANDSLVFVKKMLSVPSVSGQTAGYVQVLYEQNRRLYVLRRVVQSGVQRATRNQVMVELPVLQKRPVYYFEDQDGSMSQFQRLSRSVLYGLVDVPRSEVRRLLFQQGLSAKEEADFVRALIMMEGF
jgi:hypothetical protein